MSRRCIVCVLLVFLSFKGSVYAQQATNHEDKTTREDISPDALIHGHYPISRQNILAFEEFSWGVRAFHNGYYNNAIVDFEKALTYSPNNSLYHLWLGFANYYAGLNDSAMAQWQTLLNKNMAGYWLQSRVDTLAFRSSPYYDNLHQDTWAERGDTQGKSGRILRFLRPTSVVADPTSGGCYVASYGTNMVTVLDVNGTIKHRFSGGLVRFDGPWDVLPVGDGRFFVSEFKGKRITLVNRNGMRLQAFGSAAEEGGLTSPQYLASTEDGYLYVTDWASRRVLKYDFNGTFIMSVGEKSPIFEGLGRPGGIATSATELFVVDSDKKVIHVFDHYGNYLYNMGKDALNSPEGLRLYKGKYLIIADKNRIVEGNIEEKTFVLISDLSGHAKNVMQTAFDANGALLVTDNATNRLVYLTHLSSLYGGLSVEIRRIAAEQFPQVVLEVAVQSRSGQPVQGLQKGNFLLYDNGEVVPEFTLGAYDHAARIPVNASLLVEASPEALAMQDFFAQGLGQLNKIMVGQGAVKTFWAAERATEDISFTEYGNKEKYCKMLEKMASSFWRFDAGLRMASSALLPRTGKSVVFFLTTGQESSMAFQQYQPHELATYLKNNGILFFPIYVTAKKSCEFYDFIAKETGGCSLYLYRPQGFTDIIEQIKQQPTGLYTVSFNSRQDGDFGRTYLPVDLEVVLQKESGKTISGYFAPLR